MAVLVGSYIRFVGSGWELGVALALTIGFRGNFVIKVDGEVPLEGCTSALRAEGENTGTVGVTCGGLGGFRERAGADLPEGIEVSSTFSTL